MSGQPAGDRDTKQAEARASALHRFLALTGMNSDELWFEYAELGGDRSPAEVASHLRTGTAWPPLEAAILAHVLNERLAERGYGSLPD